MKEVSRRQMASGYAGTTLVELIVVICIISILAALLEPMLISAKNASLAAGCSSNLRQIGALVIGYSTDHDGDLPYALINKSGSAFTWWTMLGISGSSKVFMCPASRNEKLVITNVAYGLNLNICKVAGPTETVPQNLRMVQVRAPAITVLGADSTAEYSDAPGQPQAYWSYRHQNNISVLFCDGHTQLMNKAAFTSNQITFYP